MQRGSLSQTNLIFIFLSTIFLAFSLNSHLPSRHPREGGHRRQRWSSEGLVQIAVVPARFFSLRFVRRDICLLSAIFPAFSARSRSQDEARMKTG